MKAFQIKIDNQILDYRIGEELDLNEVKIFFENKRYKIIKFLSQQRHVCAILLAPRSPKGEVGSLRAKRSNLFLKLSTSKGISIVTENEAAWNDAINSTPAGWLNRLPAGEIHVPKIHDRGYFKNDYFYMITDYLDGPSVTPEVAEAKIDQIVDLSEKIMSLKISLLPADSYNSGKDYREKFLNKTKSHFESVPLEVRRKYRLDKLLRLIEVGISSLECRPRHGDFAPWHLILKNNLFLLDGEHAMSQGVEYYDIGYFIQRVFSVWKKPELAKKIYQKLIDRGYNKNKLKTILLARTIGGFLDESLTPNPDYSAHKDLKNWLHTTLY